MSQFLSLIKFTPNEQNLITEKNSETILRTNVNEQFLTELKGISYFEQTLIPEDDNSHEETEYTFLNENDIQAVQVFIRKKIESYLISLNPERIASEYEDITSDLFLLLNLKQLIELKQEYDSSLVRVKVSI